MAKVWVIKATIAGLKAPIRMNAVMENLMVKAPEHLMAADIVDQETSLMLFITPASKLETAATVPCFKMRSV